MAKEHFVFTDPEGQLYHFSVEGNTIRDGTKVMMFRYELQFWRPTKMFKKLNERYCSFNWMQTCFRLQQKADLEIL